LIFIHFSFSFLAKFVKSNFIFTGQIRLVVSVINADSLLKVSDFFSKSLSNICIFQYASSCQLGNALIFLSINIQLDTVINVIINIKVLIIHLVILFFLNSFLVKRNLNKNIINVKISRSTIIEKIIQIAVSIKLLMSFKLIPRE
jgi:hypothetical protein